MEDEEFKDPYKDINNQLEAENEQLRSRQDALSKQRDELLTQPSSAYDVLSKQVEEQKASMETPEDAERRKRDQRNAAMWTAVTDGIGQIFQLTHAATNPNAVPMQAISTSVAVQQAAEKADERYERQKAKLDQLNQQLAGFRDKDRMARISGINDQHKELQTRIKENRDRIARNQDMWWKQSEANRQQGNFDASEGNKMKMHKDTMRDHAANRANQRTINTANNESAERRANANAQAKADAAARKKAEEAAKKPSKEKNDAAYNNATAEQKKKVNSAMRAYEESRNGKPIGDDEREAQRKKALEDAGVNVEMIAGFEPK